MTQMVQAKFSDNFKYVKAHLPQLQEKIEQVMYALVKRDAVELVKTFQEGIFRRPPILF